MAAVTTLPAAFVANTVLTAAQLNDLRGAFRILQVVQGTTTTSGTSTSATYADSTLTANITPTFTTSKILIMVSQCTFSNAANTGLKLNIMRGATQVLENLDINYLAGAGTDQWNMIFLDSPVTTSATTYKTQFARSSGAGTVTIQPSSNISTLILCEISAA
jgi:hypothetical protein